jgi:hypothetical protein
MYKKELFNMKTQLLTTLLILTFLVTGCSQAVTNIEDLHYEDIISNQYSNPKSSIEVEKILWKKIINNNEVFLLYLNKNRTISVSRIAYVNDKWETFITTPIGRSGDEEISWQWSLISNPSNEDKPEVAAVIWGYIYSSEVEKILVGSDKEEELFEEAKILDFEDYGIKVYYFLTDDETGFEYNTVVAYDNLGNALFTNRD